MATKPKVKSNKKSVKATPKSKNKKIVSRSLVNSPKVLSRKTAFIMAALIAVTGVYLVYQSFATTSTTSNLKIGFVSDLTWAISPADQDRTITELKASGAKWVRLSVNWYDAEPNQKGVYNQYWLDHYARAIDLSNQAGIGVLVNFTGSPSWASGSTNVHTPPRNPQDFTDFVKYMATRNQGKVYAYEIWNEQNTTRFWSTGVDPAAYTKILQAGYTGTKLGDPNAKVMYGGTSSSDYGFLSGVYAAGGKNYFDIMATHPYTYCGSTGPDDVRTGGDGKITKDSYTAYRELRKVMLANNDDKPMWFTEMGWSTTTLACNPGAGQWVGGVSEQNQANYMTRAFQIAQQDPYVEVALWYNFRNNYWMNNADDPESRFGLLRTDFTQKPAFNAFKTFAQQLGQFGTPTVSDPVVVVPPPTTGTTTPPPAPDALPNVSIVAPVSNATFTSSLLIRANASDDKGITKVAFYENGRLLNTDTVAPYEYNWGVRKKTPYGTYSIDVVAYDTAGQSAKATVLTSRVR